MATISTNGNRPVAFFNFSKENRVFSGYFMGEGSLESKPTEKLFKFREVETGIVYWINPSKAISDGLDFIVKEEVKDEKGKIKEPSLKLKETDLLIHISFIEQIKLKNGRKFNQFAVSFEMPE